MAVKYSTQDVFSYQQILSAFKQMLKVEKSNIVEGIIPSHLEFVGDVFADMAFKQCESVSKSSLSGQEVALIERYLQ
jgi:hypothetical protein